MSLQGPGAEGTFDGGSADAGSTVARAGPGRTALVARHTASYTSRSMRPRLLCLAAVAALMACQPVDEPLPDEAGEAATSDDGADEPVGGPEEGMPDDIGALLERTEPEAARWQSDPRPAEVTVDLAEQGWAAAAVTYVAAEADSALTVQVQEDGASTERLSFEPLGLEPISAQGVEQLPPLSELDAAPERLAEVAEEHFDDCDADTPARRVRLATGAPAAWQDGRWAQTPRWRAVVTDENGAGVAVDPGTGDVDEQGCVSAELG